MCAASSFVLSQDCLGCLESFGYVNQLSGDNLFKRMTNEVKLLSCLQLFAVLHYRLPGPSVHGLLHGPLPSPLKCLGFSLKAHSLNFPPKSIIPYHSLAIIRAIWATNGTKWEKWAEINFPKPFRKSGMRGTLCEISVGMCMYQHGSFYFSGRELEFRRGKKDKTKKKWRQSIPYLGTWA